MVYTYFMASSKLEGTVHIIIIMVFLQLAVERDQLRGRGRGGESSAPLNFEGELNSLSLSS